MNKRTLFPLLILALILGASSLMADDYGCVLGPNTCPVFPIDDPPPPPPPFDCTPANPCNCGGEDNPCPTAVVGGQNAGHIPLVVWLKLMGRL